MMQMPITIAVELPASVLDALDQLRLQNTEIARRLSAVERAITRNTVNDMITREALMVDFTELTADVQANGDAVDSAITLLNGLSAQLADAANDPADALQPGGGRRGFRHDLGRLSLDAGQGHRYCGVQQVSGNGPPPTHPRSITHDHRHHAQRQPR